jgi:hypothetical protein
MSTNNKAYRITYLRDKNNHPVGCVAFIFNRNIGCVDYNYSVLNPLDIFDRKMARQLAIGRLAEAPRNIRINSNSNLHEVSRAIMRDMTTWSIVPTRAYKAAKEWIMRDNLEIASYLSDRKESKSYDNSIAKDMFNIK